MEVIEREYIKEKKLAFKDFEVTYWLMIVAVDQN